MREKTIESRLVKEVKSMGGLPLKFVSQGLDGVPDMLEGLIISSVFIKKHSQK